MPDLDASLNLSLAVRRWLCTLCQAPSGSRASLKTPAELQRKHNSTDLLRRDLTNPHLLWPAPNCTVDCLLVDKTPSG